MAAVHSEIDIAAEPARVWELLSQLDGYADWNPSIAGLRGTLAEGERLWLRARMPGGIELGLRPVLTRLEPRRQLAWSAHLLSDRFFSAEHRFSIEPLPSGFTRFTQHETFDGWFAPIFALLFASRLQRAYGDANARLKSLAEDGAAREKRPLP